MIVYVVNTLMENLGNTEGIILDTNYKYKRKINKSINRKYKTKNQVK